ncbi:MAG: metal-dependent hydrolase [Thermoplasmataceae archaeon]|jgi:L-ascorbate metabolism protein UlaG (beta-lactamase superfamily)
MVKVKWLGHAAFLVEFSKKRIVIDPFISQNPNAAIKLDQLGKVDFVLVTHNHFDHLGDAFEISKKTGAKIVGMFELSQMGKEAGVGEDNFIGMNKGSQTEFDGIKIGMTAAVHSGNEAGFVVTGDGKTIYHAGDTALFGDMKLIGEIYKPDLALLPIGGFFTMSPLEAKYAAELIGAKITVPMHFNTFPPIKQDPKKFKEMVQKNTEVKVLEPGQEISL